jgi:fatty-acyl-CoA synthase
MTAKTFKTGLGKNPANYVPLTPISFLRRAAKTYGDDPAVIYGERAHSWRQTYQRCRRLAAALASRGIGRGDVVSILAPNIPAMIEAHFGVPMAGAVLNAINTRLDEETLAYIFRHAESKAILCDGEFAAKAARAARGMNPAPLLVDIRDDAAPYPPAGEIEYEALLADGGEDGLCLYPEDEWDAIALNYTSGTTGRPKGVVYHHRGAYLTAMGTAAAWRASRGAAYLYVVPLFHCNGWCHAWMAAMTGGKMICLRKIDADEMYQLIGRHKVEYTGGAPIILSMLLNAPAQARDKLNHKMQMLTAAAPPPPAVLEGMAKLGVEVLHVYGLTETFGHVTMCEPRVAWDKLKPAEQAAMHSRQGVGFAMMEDWAVLDRESERELPADGETMGEVALRGNTVMAGYYKDEAATKAAFRGGWFHSGDLGVMHPDSYLQIKDRAKDIVISGGENISSIEVEGALCRHPAVLAAAVVAMPDEKWGETPCAFVERKNEEIREEELIAFCREHLAHYKCPRRVVFGELPKTATGKIKKFELRERAKKL